MIRRRAGALAAAAAIAIVVPTGWHYIAPPTPAIERQVYASTTATRRDVQLPDGSAMALDAASRVAIAFAGDARVLDLTQGAARFEVVHDRTRPFTVATRDARMTALGTNFSVDTADGDTELRVFRGRVRLTVGGYAPVVVTAGEWALVTGGTPHLHHFDPADYRAWQDDWLEGEAIPLEIALARLSRYAPRPIRLADPRLALEPVSGRFRLDTPRTSAIQIAALFDLTLVDRGGAWWLERRQK